MVWFIAKYTNDPYEAVGDNFASNTSVNAYPNPASGGVNIVYELPVDLKEAKLAVFNVLGNKVLEMPLNSVSGLEELNISGLNNGMYFYSVMINNNLYGTKKLIVKN